MPNSGAGSDQVHNIGHDITKDSVISEEGRHIACDRRENTNESTKQNIYHSVSELWNYTNECMAPPIFNHLADPGQRVIPAEIMADFFDLCEMYKDSL